MNESIINGIDVSECEFLECGMCNAQRNCDGYTGIECKYDNKNCYYRQLKRLQEENDILKQAIKNKNFVAIVEENEELKKKNKELLNLCNNGGALLVTESAKTKKYKQALEEIKEMILGFGNTPIEFKTLNIPLKEEDLKTNEGKFFDFYTKLKDKINEVLKNET